MSRWRCLTVVLLLVLGGSSGCATVIKGLGEEVTFTSNPPGAKIYLEGDYVGQTPVKAKVKHGKDKQVEARMPGYLTKQSTITTSFSGYSLCLIYFSLLVDLATGSIWTVDNKMVHFGLTPLAQPGMVMGMPVGMPPPGRPAIALKNKHLAVLEFQDKQIAQEIMGTFSDDARGAAVDALAFRGVDIMTRENIFALLKDMGKGECVEGDCEVETARNIGADLVVTGNIVQIESTYVVTLKLHETQRGTLLGSESAEATTQLGLRKTIREVAKRLLTKSLTP
jgi:hypothetical protein